MKPCHVLRRAATRNLPISRFSNRRIFKPLNAMSCGLLCRHRCRSTIKTVTHLGQPYVVKAGFPYPAISRYASCRIATHSLSVYE